MKIEKVLVVMAFISGLLAVCGATISIWYCPELGDKIALTGIIGVVFFILSIVLNGLSKEL